MTTQRDIRELRRRLDDEARAAQLLDGAKRQWVRAIRLLLAADAAARVEADADADTPVLRTLPANVLDLARAAVDLVAAALPLVARARGTTSADVVHRDAPEMDDDDEAARLGITPDELRRFWRVVGSLAPADAETITATMERPWRR